MIISFFIPLFHYSFSISKDGNRYTTRMIVTKLEGNDEGKNTFIEVDNGNGLHNYTITYTELDGKYRVSHSKE